MKTLSVEDLKIVAEMAKSEKYRNLLGGTQKQRVKFLTMVLTNSPHEFALQTVSEITGYSIHTIRKKITQLRKERRISDETPVHLPGQ